MRDRCLSPSNRDYPGWGGRGIKICAEWLNDFEAFDNWAHANGYKEGLLLDRRDNDGDYEPGNCRWVTYTEQARNRRGNTVLTAFGETKTAIEWATDPRCVVDYATLLARIRRQGLPVEFALTHPPQPFGKRHLHLIPHS
jgi:hypothetical protein